MASLTRGTMRRACVAMTMLIEACLVPTIARAASVEDLLQALVEVRTFINPEGRTTETLGRERSGTGVVIDGSGLVLTIGYIMVEAHAAELVTHDGRTVGADIVGYDHETGFGLLRASGPLKVTPMKLGKSTAATQGERVLVASFGGADMVLPASIVSRREFAGNWEYLLDEAIYTSPPHPKWAGAALINRDGQLLGIGSLFVGDATGRRDGRPGNMMVPIDRLQPILAELIADGRVSGAGRPWLGMAVDDDGAGRLTVSRLTPGGPSEKAGIKKGAVISAVSGKKPLSLADFYRKVWALGGAGAIVPLDVEQTGGNQRVELKSMNRMDHLKLKSTF